MIRKLAKSIREYKAATIVTPCLMVGEVSMECMLPLITAKLINSIEQGCDMRQIIRYGLILLLMALLSMSFGIGAGITGSKAATGFAKNLRHDLFEKIKSFSFSNIDSFSSSSLVTRMTTDISNVQMAFMMLTRMAFRAPLMLVFSIIMAVYVGGSLAGVFVLVLPLLGFALYLIAKNAMPLFKSVFKKYDRLNNSIQENVQSMRVVKSFVREEYEQEKFGKASGDVAADFTKAERIVALNSPVMMVCIYFCMLAIPYMASKIIIMSSGADMMVGNLSSLITYSVQILSSLMMLSMLFVMMTISMESARRITEILDTEPTIVNPENPVCEVKDGSVDFQDVAFKYSSEAQKFALYDIDLHIAPGQTVGIIGGTGSSKTTLIQLISRLYDATEGEVRVGGINVKDYDLTVLRNAVSVVLQKNLLFSGTIAENLRWGDPEASDEELKRACKLAQADDFIMSLPDGYETHIEQGGTNVSGGQKQRLCIARALLKKPKILILDDSTSAVDTKTDALIRKAFREEIPDTTKIIIAQRIASVEDADLILVMDNGKIMQQGTHEELLKTSDIYREVYESQTKGGEENA